MIAKRSRRETMLIERLVYQDILPALPVHTLRCYGFVEEESGESCWLFLEDACGERYSAALNSHRLLAAQWLGAVHTGTSVLDIAPLFPASRLDDYLSDLLSARDVIRTHLGNPVLTSDDRRTLEGVIEHCDWIELRWGEIEQLFECMPQCLVHGDFTAKNLRVRTDDTQKTLSVMDWETAGWGVPAVDLAAVDLDEYQSAVHEYWPQVDADAIRMLAQVGSMFLNLGFVRVASLRLGEVWARHVVEELACYEPRLALAREALK